MFYDDDAFVEPSSPLGAPQRDQAAGLVGRQVAGRSFLDAFLRCGSWTDLTVLVRQRSSVRSLERFCREHPSSRLKTRKLRIFEERHFHTDFAGDPPARQLYFPFPIDSRYAWARQRLGIGSFSLSGVTHTLCTANAVRQLCDYVTAPYEPHDALICTSAAVEGMVRQVTQSYADYLRERHGGTPRSPVRLEIIPLGVNTERFRPATPDERECNEKCCASATTKLWCCSSADSPIMQRPTRSLCSVVSTSRRRQPGAGASPHVGMGSQSADPRGVCRRSAGFCSGSYGHICRWNGHDQSVSGLARR